MGFFLAFLATRKPGISQQGSLQGGAMPEEQPLSIHPAALAMPELPASEYQALKADIAKNGQQVPIVLLDDQVIDGRHRYRACRELDIECWFDVLELEDLSPEEWVWSVNGLRRHLAPSQRACIAYELFGEAAEARAKERRLSPLAQNCANGQEATEAPLAQNCANGKSSEEVSARASVSPRLVEFAREVYQSRPDLFQECKLGTMSLSEARETVRAHKREQEELAAECAAAPTPRDILTGAVTQDVTYETKPPLAHDDQQTPVAQEEHKPVCAGTKSAPKPTKASTGNNNFVVSDDDRIAAATTSVLSLGRPAVLSVIERLARHLLYPELCTLRATVGELLGDDLESEAPVTPEDACEAVMSCSCPMGAIRRVVETIDARFLITIRDMIDDRFEKREESEPCE